MSYNRQEFHHAVLHALHAPETEAVLKALNAWDGCEDSHAQWNSFDTTLWQPGATPYNTFYVNGKPFHVWNYPSMTAGVKATVETLRNGYYPHLLHELVSGRGWIASGRAGVELHTWGTYVECVHNKIVGS